jgi:hypothetical protein
MVNEMKYTAEQQKSIMAEARRNVARPRPKIDAAPPPVAPIKYRTIDDAIDEPATPKPEPQQQPPLQIDWSGYISDRIAEAVAAERRFVLDVVGKALGRQLADLDEGFEDIKAHLDQLDALLKELRVSEDRALDWPTARRAAAVN